jgi:hypothetical protein
MPLAEIPYTPQPPDPLTVIFVVVAGVFIAAVTLVVYLVLCIRDNRKKRLARELEAARRLKQAKADILRRKEKLALENELDDILVNTWERSVNEL